MRREDQDKINKFSRLHQKELSLEEDLKTKAVCFDRPTAPLMRPKLTKIRIQKEKEELDEITAELELADEDDLIP